MDVRLTRATLVPERFKACFFGVPKLNILQLKNIIPINPNQKLLGGNLGANQDALVSRSRQRMVNLLRIPKGFRQLLKLLGNYNFVNTDLKSIFKVFFVLLKDTQLREVECKIEGSKSNLVDFLPCRLYERHNFLQVFLKLRFLRQLCRNQFIVG